MRKLRKTLSILFVVSILAAMLSMPVMAAGTNTITINSKTSGHTYQAYQVFKGTYSATNVLSNVAWGSGVNSANLLAALKGDSTYGSHFTSCTSAADVADVISTNYTNDADFSEAFADLVAANLGSIYANSSEAGSGPYTYTITGLPDGYYFVNEAALTGDNAYTKYILQVVNDVTVNAKTDSPAVAKKVLEDNDATYKDTWNDAADYDIGDAVPFRLVGLVPNMSYYDTYYYQFTDTLSGGMTFNSSDVKVYYVSNAASMYAVETSTATGAGGTEITSGYTVNPTTGGFTVTFNDLKSVSGVSGTNGGYIVVEYTATLNSNAVIANPGNPNEVFLTYSNNPNHSGTGESSTNTGETPKDEVVVYTFQLPVEKVNDSENPLTGATFAVFTSKTDADAAVADPTALTNALAFTGSAGSYKLDSSGTEKVLSSDANGKYAVNGLDQGTYYLVEIKEPTGYNRLTAPVKVTITPVYVGTKYIDGHIPDVTGDQLTSVGINDGTKVTVINKAGSTLPGTGGMGTTLFTVIGLILMAGAGILLIAKKKMSSSKNR